MSYIAALALIASLSAPLSAAESPAAALSSPEAAYHFALARMAFGEGAYSQALDAYGKAVALAPDEPYVRLEHARLLARLVRYTRSPQERERRSRRAIEEAEIASRLADGDVDLLSELGQVYLALSEHDPTLLTAARDLYLEVSGSSPYDPRVLVPLGQIHLRLSENEAAVTALRQALRATPGNNRVEWLLGRGLEALAEESTLSGHSEQAEEMLVEAIAADPTSTSVRRKLADLLTRRGESERAIETLRGGAPERAAELRERLAYELYLVGRYQEASAELDRAPEGEGAPRLEMLLLGAQGETQAALELAITAPAGEPGAGQGAEQGAEGGDEQVLGSIVAVARQLVRDSKPALAAELLEALASHFEEGGKALLIDRVQLELAQIDAGAGRWQEAVARLAPVAERLTENGEALALPVRLFQAEGLAEMGRGDEALALLASLPDGEGLEIQAKRAEILVEIGRVEEGQAILTTLAAGDLESQLTAARVHQVVKHYSEAIAVLDAVVARRPEGAQALFLLGAAHERLGNFPRAVETFERLIELDPRNHQALNYLGYLWAERGENLEEARELVDRAVALDPENGAYLDSLGWAYYQLGDAERARGFLERAARLQGDDPTVLEHLGEVYRELGQADRARDVYRRGLALEGENQDTLRRKIRELDEGR